MVGPGDLDYGKGGGLVPVIVQDVVTGEIRMLGFANPEAVERTLDTWLAHFYSRTRRRLWMKGETSGNTLSVVSVTADCDLDTLLVKAVPRGPTCHTGHRTCFHNPLASRLRGLLAEQLSSGLPRPATPLLAALIAEAAAHAYPPGTVDVVVDDASDPTYPAYVAARLGARLARSGDGLIVQDEWRPRSGEVFAILCPGDADARCVARRAGDRVEVEGWVP